MDNKIKLEDTCLTVEQAKELQSLGIDMSGSIGEANPNTVRKYIKQQG